MAKFTPRIRLRQMQNWINGIFLLLGGNVGDRQQYLGLAITQIQQHRACQLVKISSLYETLAWPDPTQPKYLNQVVQIKSLLSPHELLTFCQNVEHLAGRVRTQRYGNRTLDVDILLYGNEIVETDNLKIPHPEMHNRMFTLQPLLEIAPECYHPRLKKPFSDFFKNLESQTETSSLFDSPSSDF